MKDALREKIIISTIDDENPKRKLPASTMQVFVKLNSGESISLNVAPSYSCDDLLYLINQKTKDDMTHETAYLMYGGRIMKSTDTIESLNMKALSTIHQYARMGGRLPKKVTIKFESSAGLPISTMEVPGNTTMVELKWKLWNVYASKVPSNTAFWNGLKPSGDGFLTGTSLEDEFQVGRYCKTIVKIPSKPKKSPKKSTKSPSKKKSTTKEKEAKQ